MAWRRMIAASAAVCALAAPLALAGCTRRRPVWTASSPTTGPACPRRRCSPPAPRSATTRRTSRPAGPPRTGRSTATSEHYGETVYVGTLTGAAAERADPPEAGRRRWSRAAFAECDERATAFVGRSGATAGSRST